MKNNIFWGIKPQQAKKQKKEAEMSLDEALGKVKYSSKDDKKKVFTPDHQAYSILKLSNKEFKIIKVDIELSTLQSVATMLESVYDSESRAVMEMNKLFADQSKKMRSNTK